MDKYRKVTIVENTMGSGMTNYITAQAVDEYLKVESPDRYIHKVQAMIDALPKSGGILRLDNLMD